jgi:glutamyl-tRNA synthetase
MNVICRVAPSPTGYMHIGTARTALFNYLFAKHHGGKFCLRIEDTDRERSTPEATQAIFDGFKWLGLAWDGEPVMQFARAPRHAEVANELVKQGKAYHCYCTPDELAAMRDAQKAAGQPMRYDGRWRDSTASPPDGIKPVIRLKAPQTGETVVQDAVLGEIKVQNNQLDDLILLRSDGTPTYMLSVVVDDHDMGITHVIRGNDHMTNTFRQVQIYQAMGWEVPHFAHLPLIHGEDGQKLSKRHGALGVEEYAQMGYLPEAMRNYLLRLGWGHGDAEIISDEEAIEWFDLGGIVKSPARFDFKKLDALNAHYLRLADNDRLLGLLAPFLAKYHHGTISAAALERVKRGMDSLKQRAKTLVELAESAMVYVMEAPATPDEKAAAVLDAPTKDMLREMLPLLKEQNDWSAHAIEEKVRSFAEAKGLKLGKVAQPLRVAITGTTVSPPIFEVAEILDREPVILRIETSIGC